MTWYLGLVVVLISQNSQQPEDLSALFHQNRLKASTLRVHWAVTSGRSEGIVKKWDYELTFADRPGVTLTAEDIRKTQDRDTPRIKTVMEQDFWTDRENIQLRFSADGGESGLAKWRWQDFPDEVPTATNLSSTFRRVAISSFGPATNQQSHRWNGEWASGEGSGTIGPLPPQAESRFQNVHPIWFMPPLAFPGAQWRNGASKIDQFFDDSVVYEKTLGEATIDGVSTIALLRQWEFDLKLSKGLTRCRETMIGFIDPRRGCLPLRIEVYRSFAPFDDGLIERLASQLPWNGKFSRRHGIPTQVVRNIEIKQQDGVFYPVSGFCVTMSALGELGDQDVECVEIDEARWDVKKFEVNRPMPKEMFAFLFPQGTIVNDVSEGLLKTVGGTDGKAEMLLHKLGTPPKKKPSSSRWMYVALGLSLLAGAVVIFRRIRRGAR